MNYTSTIIMIPILRAADLFLILAVEVMTITFQLSVNAIGSVKWKVNNMHVGWSFQGTPRTCTVFLTCLCTSDFFQCSNMITSFAHGEKGISLVVEQDRATSVPATDTGGSSQTSVCCFSEKSKQLWPPGLGRKMQTLQGKEQCEKNPENVGVSSGLLTC